MIAFKRIAVLAMVAILAVTAMGPMTFAQGGAPQVVCVPASALNPAVPHDTWSELGDHPEGHCPRPRWGWHRWLAMNGISVMARLWKPVP